MRFDTLSLSGPGPKDLTFTQLLWALEDLDGKALDEPDAPDPGLAVHRSDTRMTSARSSRMRANPGTPHPGSEASTKP
jgi:hypothetical protein